MQYTTDKTDDIVLANWCSSIQLHRKHRQLSYTECRYAGSIKRPESYTRMIVLVEAMLTQFTDSEFPGGLVWVMDWGIWSETVTVDLFNRVRSTSSSQTRTLVDAPVSIFAPGEYDSFYLLSLLTVLGQWDAAIIPPTPGYYLNISHDGFIYLVAQDAPTVVPIIAAVEKKGFQISPSEARRFSLPKV